MIVSNGQFPAPLNLDLRIEVKKFGYEPVRFQTRLTGEQPAAFRLELSLCQPAHLAFLPRQWMQIYRSILPERKFMKREAL